MTSWHGLAQARTQYHTKHMIAQDGMPSTLPPSCHSLANARSDPRCQLHNHKQFCSLHICKVEKGTRLTGLTTRQQCRPVKQTAAWQLAAEHEDAVSEYKLISSVQHIGRSQVCLAGTKLVSSRTSWIQRLASDRCVKSIKHLRPCDKLARASTSKDTILHEAHDSTRWHAHHTTTLVSQSSKCTVGSSLSTPQS